MIEILEQITSYLRHALVSHLEEYNLILIIFSFTTRKVQLIVLSDTYSQLGRKIYYA